MTRCHNVPLASAGDVSGAVHRSLYPSSCLWLQSTLTKGVKFGERDHSSRRHMASPPFPPNPPTDPALSPPPFRVAVSILFRVRVSSWTGRDRSIRYAAVMSVQQRFDVIEIYTQPDPTHDVMQIDARCQRASFSHPLGPMR